MTRNVDTRELTKLYEKLKKAGRDKAFRKSVGDELAKRLLRDVKKNTPVDTGELRRNWNTESFESAKSYDVEIYNQTSYASYVEYGHRTRGGGGFVPGKLMLTNGELRIRKKAPAIIKKRLNEMVEELGL